MASSNFPSKEHWWPATATDDVLLPFLVHRVVIILAVGFLATLGPLDLGTSVLPRLPLLNYWIRWDSVYYLAIADVGYGPNPWLDVQAYSPGYPAFIAALGVIIPAPIAALLIANFGALVGMLAMYHLALHHFDRAAARQTVRAVLLFPTSYFLVAAYSEGLFLACVAVTCWAWQKRWWRVAALAVFFGTMTRPVGAFCLTLPFVIAWIVMLIRRRETQIPAFVLAVIPGAMVVMGLHFLATGDPLGMFGSSLSPTLGGKVWRQVEPNLLAVLWDEGFSRNLMIRLLNWSGLLWAAVMAVAWARRGRLDYVGIIVLCMAIPLAFHGSLFDSRSLARYALVAAPAFVVFGRWLTQTRLRAPVEGLMFALQVGLATHFAMWRWAE